jgi:hypothetical protein
MTILLKCSFIVKLSCFYVWTASLKARVREDNRHHVTKPSTTAHSPDDDVSQTTRSMPSVSDDDVSRDDDVQISQRTLGSRVSDSDIITTSDILKLSHISSSTIVSGSR